MRSVRFTSVVLLALGCESSSQEAGERGAADGATTTESRSPPPDYAVDVPDDTVAASESLPPEEETDALQPDDAIGADAAQKPEADETAQGSNDIEGLADVADLMEYGDDALIADASESQPDTPVAGSADEDTPTLQPFDCNVPVGPEETVLSGDFLAASQLDIDALSGISRIQGSLFLAGGVEVIALPNLRCIAGRLEVSEDETLKALSLPNLFAVGHDEWMLQWGIPVVIASNPQLESIDLSGLAFATAGLHVRDNPKLLSIGLETLERVDVPVHYGGYGLQVSNNDALFMLTFPSLTDVAALGVAGNGALEVIDAPIADVAMIMTVTANPKLKYVHLPGTVGLLMDEAGNLNDWDELTITDNAALESVSLPGLTGTTHLTITDNPSLTALDLPVFERGCFATISSNSALSQCQADAVGEGVVDWMLSKCDHMAMFGGNGLVSEDNLGTCP